MTNVNEREILEAALLGYQSQVRDLQDKMRAIAARLMPGNVAEPDLEAGPKLVKRRRFSAATRAKMAAAQKRRWKLVKRAAA